MVERGIDRLPDSEIQPEYYSKFRCLANACPDTCCEGWQVPVDGATYAKYEECSDAVLGPAFQQLVTINPAPTSEHYGTFVTTGARCGFLSEGLCSIQKRLGEDYLGNACAAFPRVSNLVNSVVERSLDLSCPEAARLALTNEVPLHYQMRESDSERTRQMSYGSLAKTALSHSESEGVEASENGNVTLVRTFVVGLLQNRKYRLATRLRVLAQVCERLDEIASKGRPEATQGALRGFAFAMDQGLEDECLDEQPAHAARQLGLVVQLIQKRITDDFTHGRFLQLYSEFVGSIRGGQDAEFAQMAMNYAEGRKKYFEPFMERHEYMLEHYLVNNAFKTLFPFGSGTVNESLKLPGLKPISEQYMLLTSYYGIIRGILIGLAGLNKASFGADEVVRAVQLCAKTFEHSVRYPARVLSILAENGIHNCYGMAILTQG